MALIVSLHIQLQYERKDQRNNKEKYKAKEKAYKNMQVVKSKHIA